VNQEVPEVIPDRREAAKRVVDGDGQTDDWRPAKAPCGGAAIDCDNGHSWRICGLSAIDGMSSKTNGE